MKIDLVLVRAGDRLAAVATALGKYRKATLAARRTVIVEAERAGGAPVAHFDDFHAAEAAVGVLAKAGAEVRLSFHDDSSALALVRPALPGDPPAEAVEAELVDDTPSGALADELRRCGDDVRAALELVGNVLDPALLEDALRKAKDDLHPDVRAVAEDRMRDLRRPSGAEPSVHVEELASGSKTLWCVLTPEERADAASQVVDLTQQLDDLDIEAKAAARSFKARAELLEGVRRVEMAKHRIGREERSVEWVRVFDIAADRVRTIRTDTNEVIEDRAPTKEERQRPLFGERASA